MDCSEKSDMNASRSISGSNLNSNAKTIKTKVASSIKNKPAENANNQNLESCKNQNEDMKLMENSRFITPSELSDPSSTESYIEDTETSNQETSYKKGPTPSLLKNYDDRGLKEKIFKDYWRYK